jgi:hypothetical protein
VATNTCDSTRIVGRVFFCEVRIISKENLRVCVSLLCNGSVHTFPRQRRMLQALFSVRSVLYQRKVGE